MDGDCTFDLLFISILVTVVVFTDFRNRTFVDLTMHISLLTQDTQDTLAREPFGESHNFDTIRVR